MKKITFKLNIKPPKQEAINKSLYIRQFLVDQIDEIAIENDTSFNNVVISILQTYLEDTKEQ